MSPSIILTLLATLVNMPAQGTPADVRLTEMVPESKLTEVLRQPGLSTEICRKLIDLALEAGGKDNVTAVVARYHIPASPSVTQEGP